MTVSARQVINNYSSIPYAKGLDIKRTGNTTATVSSGVCRDINNRFEITLANTSTLDFSVIGHVNGLDSGTIAASKCYYVHIIGDYSSRKTTGVLASLSMTAPTLPFGYNVYKCIGFLSTDASSHIRPVGIYGAGSCRTYMFHEPVEILLNGAETSFTKVSLESCVPAIESTPIKLQQIFYSTTTAEATVRPYGSSSADYYYLGGGGSVNVIEYVDLMVGLYNGAPTIEYIVTAGNLDLYLTSFVYAF